MVQQQIPNDLIKSSEILWTDALNDVILHHTGTGLSNADLAGWTTKWYTEGKTPEEAFHNWITLHYL